MQLRAYHKMQRLENMLATVDLHRCTICRVARFCGKECAVRMRPVHKAHCKRWKAEASAAASNEA